MAKKKPPSNGPSYVFEVVAPNGAILPPVIHAKSCDEAAEKALKLLGASVRMARNSAGEPMRVRPNTKHQSMELPSRSLVVRTGILSAIAVDLGVAGCDICGGGYGSGSNASSYEAVALLTLGPESWGVVLHLCDVHADVVISKHAAAGQKIRHHARAPSN